MRNIWIAALGIMVLGTAVQARTLQEIREDGVFRVGFRMDAKPFSFLDSDGNAAGYSVDLTLLGVSYTYHVSTDGANVRLCS